MKKVSFSILMAVMVLSMMLFYQHSFRSERTSETNSVQSPATKSGLPELASKTDHSIVRLTIADQPFSVEVVNSPASITLGLSGRSQIGQDGMLFVLPDRRVASFWMKDMLFDLDLVWIDGDTIVGVTADVPAPKPGLLLSQLPSYSSTTLVTHVLEVPAGTAMAKGLTVESKILMQ